MNKLGIRNQIRGLLNRNDLTDTQADIFIDQAVARIQRTLRIPPMERTMITTVADSSPELIVLPNDFLQLKNLYTDKGTLEYKDLGQFLQIQDAPGNYPKYYTRVQGSYLVKPSPPEGLQINMIYYGEIADLVNETDENFLSVICPDLLVYGALIYAADFFVDDRRDSFEAVATRIFDELISQSLEMEFAQEGMAISTAFYAPEY